MKANGHIRRAAKACEIPFWQICDEMGISEPTFTRLMRKPLTEEKEQEILSIIKRLSLIKLERMNENDGTKMDNFSDYSKDF